MAVLAEMSAVLGPIVVAISLWSFAHDVPEGLRDIRAVLFVVPAAAVVASLVAPRRRAWALPAHFLVLLTSFVAIYSAAVASSLVERPSLLVAVIASAWTLAAYGHVQTRGSDIDRKGPSSGSGATR